MELLNITIHQVAIYVLLLSAHMGIKVKMKSARAKRIINESMFFNLSNFWMDEDGIKMLKDLEHEPMSSVKIAFHTQFLHDRSHSS